MRSGYRSGLFLMAVSCTGCGSGLLAPARVELSTLDDAGRTQNHYAEFQRASYRRSSGGLIELVLESDQPSKVDPKQVITQIVYIKSYWLPIPGRTYMEATQINAEIQYAMLTPPTGIRYDGAGFVSYKLKKGSDKLNGELESGTMAPRLRMGDATEPFGPARLQGKFKAENNPREVVKAVQLLQTQFKDKVATSR